MANSAQQTANNVGYFSARQLGYDSYQLVSWERKFKLVPMNIGARYFYRKEDVAAIAKRESKPALAIPVKPVPVQTKLPLIAPQPTADPEVVKVYTWGKDNGVKHPTVSGWCQDGKIPSAYKDQNGTWFATAAELAAHAEASKHLRNKGPKVKQLIPVITAPAAEPARQEKSVVLDLKKTVNQWVKLHSQARLQQLNISNPTPAQENMFNREIYTELKRRFGMGSEACGLADLLARVNLLANSQLGVSFAP